MIDFLSSVYMRIALRIDDIGASSKEFEIYSNRAYGLGNILYLKYLPSFRAWGPYREMTVQEWTSVFKILEKYEAKLTVAITASWVEYDGRLTPFPTKYPKQARGIKDGLRSGFLEIANHGLTHCVTSKNLFRPRLFSSNRKYHREFWDWVPEKVHLDNLRSSQSILQDYFKTNIVTFVPPGNVFSDSTLRACIENGIRIINCNTRKRTLSQLKIVNNENVMAFHDREIVFEGVAWLRMKLDEMPGETEYTFIKDL